MSDSQQKFKDFTARVWREDDFKQRVLADPRGALAEMGLTFPDQVKVRVHLNASDTVNLVVPANPAESGLLDDEALSALAGGVGTGDTCFKSTCWENC
jgi:hypothetical protein